MTIAQLIVGIVMLIIFLFLDNKSPVFGNTFLFVVWMFALVNFVEWDRLSTIYLIMGLFVLFSSSIKSLEVNNKELTTIVGQKKSFLGFDIFGIILGIIFTFAMVGSVKSSSGLLIGVPIFGVISLQGLQALFAPAAIAIVGPFENRFAISIHIMLKQILKNWVFTALLVGMGMGFFHLYAYAERLISVILAMIIFTFWILMYEITKDDTTSNVNHYLYNLIITIRRTLSFV